MTYKEYQHLESKYSAAITKKRQLLAIIRSNSDWFIYGGKRRKTKQQKVLNAQNELEQLEIPPKPKHPVGYQIFIDGTYEGFVANGNKEKVKRKVKEELGHSNFTLRVASRYRDDVL